MLKYLPDRRCFVWRGSFEDRVKPEKAGFQWSSKAKTWFTRSVYIAYQLRMYADRETKNLFASYCLKMAQSAATEPLLHCNQDFYAFQEAGVEHLVNEFRRGRRYLFLADEQGLGKTIQAIGFASELGFVKLLVVCPATIRLNWCTEIEKWHIHNQGVEPILTGKQDINPKVSHTVSYALIDKAKKLNPDLIIIDEAHALKNSGAQRTKKILSVKNGILRNKPALFLSGTPLPNGKPNELWPILRRCAPDIINYMKYNEFIKRFCVIEEDPWTGITIIKGAKRQEELAVRLRASGFMTRRLKKDVLRDLPDKQYKMVVFPETGETKKVLKKEEKFNVQEIIEHGIPVGSALPEIRKEMGVAKVPQSIEYIKDLLENGAQKVVVFARHLEVIGGLEVGLSAYAPVTVVGSTRTTERAERVYRFQNDSGVRVFIGNEAAEEGITLTASSDCVLVEAEWVPGKNDQRADRLHRIGQKNCVTIHILVVQRSIDAKILSSAEYKAGDINNILNARKEGVFAEKN